MTEQDLESDDFIARLRAGDRAALAALVRGYHPRLLATARTLVSPADAEEAVQDAWIAAHRALPRFEGRSTLLTWLTRIVINQARMQLRRGGREIPFDPTEDGGDALDHRFKPGGHWRDPPRHWDLTGPDTLLTRDELQHCLEKNLAALPDNQRLLLQLRDVQGLDFDAICHILEVSASNARVLLHRARARIFQMVDHFQETGEC
ncbi:RNA polymerase sigma factor [Alloalcanivorax sp. C16-2]|uniref:RNA polymerase sigma factor n=1 Tax=Alloalcanivorax TaxID=3020832 RepID=UPI001932CBBE|nr:sigma-70 family RNA polymerase sigma factor [Alloalcanivorax marinus]MBL7250562.1 sigma-70 family RNA polymerase sigma factor [Alloalcanivorax marinus]